VQVPPLPLCWGTSSPVQAGKCLFAWDKIQRPLQLGGLSMLDMEKMGRALRMCWLWHQRVHPDMPWANLPCKGDSITTSFFMASIQCRVGSGTSIQFWLDPWLNGLSIEQLAPELFIAMMGRQWRHRTVVEALVNNA
jgi:hypothetical protein